MATTQDNTGKKYRKLPHKNIISTEFCNKVRERLNLTNKELPDSKIKQVCHLSNQLIGDWVINNADGFHIKDNGRIIVSRWLPKALRGDKEEKIEEIINNPKNDDYMKRILVARYQKSLEHFKKFRDGKKVGYYTNIESFFYLYRIIWFNSRNCKFDKAEIYQLKIGKSITKKLSKKILEGKQYFEWQFSDFRQRKKDNKRDKK
jgi:hypothetical protein